MEKRTRKICKKKGKDINLGESMFIIRLMIHGAGMLCDDVYVLLGLYDGILNAV